MFLQLCVFHSLLSPSLLISKTICLGVPLCFKDLSFCGFFGVPHPLYVLLVSYMVLDSNNEESMKDIVVGDLEYELVTLDLQTYLYNIISKKAMLDKEVRTSPMVHTRKA
uniref:Uncharacterized protein n=1 Tax=Gossypium raimondii TaxID=29730 RepID=A0A0D2NCI9_GOSRA|nr:hypothetical protein B456_001G215900 [Gossypium raimondii]